MQYTSILIDNITKVNFWSEFIRIYFCVKITLTLTADKKILVDSGRKNLYTDYMDTVAIVLNTPDDIAEIKEDYVICADGGYRHLHGSMPTAIVGDFDSLDEVPEGVQKITYPIEKNETDGQLAIDYAKERGFSSIRLYGALGGRIEHILGNIGLLAYAASVGIDAEIAEANLTIRLYSASFDTPAKLHEKISVVPFGGDVTVLHSRGLYYPLENLYLAAGTNRGISNIAVEKEIGLDFDQGRLLLIRYI